MHIVVKLVIAALILLGAVLAFSPKKQTSLLKSDRPVSPHTYYYYPKANFYYDSTDGNYIRFDSSSLEWKLTDKLPVQELDLGKRVRVGETVDPVWKDNQQHRLIYSVSLYSDPKDFKKKEKPAPVVEVKKVDSSEEVAKSQKKPGVKKFFERIFQSKKKKENQ